MLNYHVFKIDDPDTWPDVDCPILVWKPNCNWPNIYQWDPKAHVFLNDYDTYYPSKCLYVYITYMPYVEKELHPIKCRCGSEDFCKLGFEDDGYCICDDGFKCELQYVANEYVIGMKRIWKDIE